MPRAHRPALGGGGCGHMVALSVGSSLSVVCFKRNAVLPDGSSLAGPLFVVREWDAKVIRANSKRKPAGRFKSPNTEQALRASVRQGLSRRTASAFLADWLLPL